METNITCKNPARRVMLELITPKVIDMLNIRSNKTLNIAVTPYCPSEGTADIFENEYIILLPIKTSIKDLGIALCHELVHIKQMVTGKLYRNSAGTVWCGRQYTDSTDYLYTPWEIQAFNMQELVFRRVIEGL
jgi:hypothetical protein